jgi:hypothetical protein
MGARRGRDRTRCDLTAESTHSSSRHSSCAHRSGWYDRGVSSPNGATQYTGTWKNASLSSGGECGVAFKQWPTSDATPAQPWYSLAAGPVFIVNFATEHNLTIGSPQVSVLHSISAHWEGADPCL